MSSKDKISHISNEGSNNAVNYEFYGDNNVTLSQSMTHLIHVGTVYRNVYGYLGTSLAKLNSLNKK